MAPLPFLPSGPASKLVEGELTIKFCEAEIAIVPPLPMVEPAEPPCAEIMILPAPMVTVEARLVVVVMETLPPLPEATALALIVSAPSRDKVLP